MSRTMRVIAGKAKSLLLRIPQSVTIRPTTDAMRESLFASIGPVVEGANMADLYAGSGAVGIEALSRGARQVVFVENNRHCLEGIKVNLANTKLAPQAVVVGGQVLKCWSQLAAEYDPFDIVFVDPPYHCPDLPKIADRLILQAEGLADGGVVIIQRDRTEPLSVPCVPQQTKTFGQTQIDFFYLESAAQEENTGE